MTHQSPRWQRLSERESPQILLVEDSPTDAKLLIAYVQRTSHAHCAWVQDGETAIDYLYQQGEHAQALRPDLILLDLHLPQMSGHQVLAQVKTDRHLQQIPVLILTSSDAAEDISQAYALHANCYLIKPTDAEGLRSLTQTIDDFWFRAVHLPVVEE
jgi:two-component system, chemotaxis family, response regulator Rcp1